MEEKPKPSNWEQSTTLRLTRWLFSKRGLIALIWIVSLVALTYGIIDWRGRRAWNDYRQNYEAHVAPLELEAYIPKPVPDSENFAATPFIQRWMKTGRETDTNVYVDTWNKADNMMGDPPRGPRYEPHFEDLAAWQLAFTAVSNHAKAPIGGFRTDKLDLASRAQAAPAILEGLKENEADFAELRAASARPDCRYPIIYDMDNPWGILLPHLAKVKQTCLRLKTKACAELAMGRDEDALQDTKLMFYMADTLKTEPFLISYLVRLACVSIDIRPIWEGVAEHRWTDTQLQQLQARLTSCDFLADMQLPLHAECAGGVLTVGLLQKKGLGVIADISDMMNRNREHSIWDDEGVLNAVGWILPAGWYDREKVRYCQLYNDMYRDAIDKAFKRVFPDQMAANAARLASVTTEDSEGILATGTPAQGFWHAIIHHEYVAAMMLPGMRSVPKKAAKAQTAINEAFIACALERWRLANGQYPENLQALVPRFAAHLPNDVITGEPFKYRRTDDGRFVLYSIGWDGKDDGGVSGRSQFDDTQGDWVWAFPKS